jgi:hypothetical protein
MTLAGTPGREDDVHRNTHGGTWTGPPAHDAIAAETYQQGMRTLFMSDNRATLLRAPAR